MIYNKLEKILESIVGHEIDSSNMEELNLKNDLKMDSMQVVEMLVAIEDEFSIDIPDKYLTEEVLTNVGQLAKAIEKILGL